MTGRKYLGLLLFFIGLSACESEVKQETEKPILSRFTQPFPKRGIDFSRVVDGSLKIKTDTGEEEFTVEYFSADRTNHIKDSKGLEVFNGTVHRYRGVYYFSKFSPDTMIWFNAVEIADDKIKGFLEFDSQLRFLDDSFAYYFDKPIEKPQYLTKCSADGISFITDKKLLKSLFNQILEKAIAYEIISDENLAVSQIDTAEVKESQMELNNDDLIKSFAPNPVIDLAEIEFVAKSRFKYFVSNMSGEVMINDKCRCDAIELETNDLAAGSYLFTVIDLKSKEKQVLKFLKVQ